MNALIRQNTHRNLCETSEVGDLLESHLHIATYVHKSGNLNVKIAVSLNVASSTVYI